MWKKITSFILICTVLNIFPATPVSASAKTDAQISGLLKRLNAKKSLWQINQVASSSAGTQSRQRLGLNWQPLKVIECNLPWSGTWLFVYSDTNKGYKAAASSYFTRTSAYDVEVLIDPKSQYVVLLHTSLGGKDQCINSAFKVLSMITD